MHTPGLQLGIYRSVLVHVPSDPLYFMVLRMVVLSGNLSNSVPRNGHSPTLDHSGMTVRVPLSISSRYKRSSRSIIMADILLVSSLKNTPTSSHIPLCFDLHVGLGQSSPLRCAILSNNNPSQMMPPWLGVEMFATAK